MYDKRPYVAVSATADDCVVGWPAVGAALRARLGGAPAVVCVECYPGVFVDEVEQALREALGPKRVVRAGDALLPPAEIAALLRRDLGDDPVFGRLCPLELVDLFAQDALADARRRAAGVADGCTLVVGT